MKGGQAPVHIMGWAVQDWHSSPLRGALIAERDHLTRMVYLELLGCLHEAGGVIRREEVPGAVGVTQQEAEIALDRLTTGNRPRIVDRKGWLSNPRVSKDHKRRRGVSGKQSEKGRKRAASGKRNPDGTLASSRDPATTSHDPATIQPSVPSRSVPFPSVPVRAIPALSPAAGDTEPHPLPNGNGALSGQDKAKYVDEVWSAFRDATGQERLVPSNTELVLLQGWIREGVPLRVVLRAIADTAHAAEARRLLYFGPSVKQAAETWVRSTGHSTKA